jgi:glutamate carboxypeptidase
METPTEAPDSFQAVFDELAADLEAVGLETERVPRHETGGWLEAHPPEVDGEVQLFLGHADTVWPSGTAEERGPEVREGAVYGPGALQMKAGLTQLVFALRALDGRGRDPALPVHVFVSSDEAIGSP